MTAHTSEEQLSLYAAGDLDAAAADTVLQHVSACKSCRAQLDEFRDTLRVLASSFTESSAEDLSAFRAGLMKRLQQPSRKSTGWMWGLAAAAAMLALVLLLPRNERRPAVHGPEASVLSAVAPLPQPVVQLAVPRLEPAVSRHTRRRQQSDAGIRSVAMITHPNQPALIRMTTADPNVVILWQPDTALKDEE